MLGDNTAPIRRIAIILVALSLLSPAGLGVAAGSSERAPVASSGDTTDAAATFESTEEAVTYVRSVEEIRGHLLMSLVAVRDGDREGAVYQAEETLSEQWPIVGQQLQSENATLADDLEASLETAVTMAENESTEAYVAHLQNEVFPLLQQAESAAVDDSRLTNATFNARVVAGLLERANAEYNEGVTADGSVEEQSDYRSAQAYNARAETVYEQDIRPSLSEHAAEELDELFEMLGGAIVSTESPKEIDRLAGSITGELAEYTGIEAESSGGGSETIDRIESDLHEAVEAYDAGNPEEAKSIIKSTYLSNFEGIEGTLIENDPELVEELEADFNEELPALIDEGASTSEVREKVESMEEKLETAEGILAQGDDTEIDLTKNETTATTTGDEQEGDTGGTTQTSTPGFGVLLAALALGLVAAARYRT